MNIPPALTAKGFNSRVLTFADFEALCRQEKIALQFTPTVTRGLYTVVRNRPCIGLSEYLRGIELIYAAFHEIGHHFLHHPATCLYGQPNESKAEFQAHAIAACAVLPFPKFRNREFENLPIELIEFRHEVWQRLGL